MLAMCIEVIQTDISLRLRKENRHQTDNLFIAIVMFAIKQKVGMPWEHLFRGLH